MPKLYYTWSIGTDMTLHDSSFYKGTRREFLHHAAVQILAQYEHVLKHLSHQTEKPAALRLQNALAGAVEDVDAEKFRSLYTDQLEDLRSRCGANRLFTPQTAPPLVVFLGSKRPSPALKSSPSTSGSLTYLSSEQIQEDIDSTEEDDTLDESPWPADWDAKEGPWPCNWGWHVRANDEQSFYLFLSGAYVAWLRRFSPVNLASLERLTTHMKATMFHELTHMSRTAVHGRIKLTPEKACDTPQRAVNGFGEGGRLAEALAFGGVVDLLLTNGEITLFTTDWDTNPPQDYWIDDYTLAGLFHTTTTPIDIQWLRSSKKHRLTDIPDYARSKEGGRPKDGGCDEMPSYQEIDLPEPSPPSTASALAPHPSGLVLITGELAETINRNREHINWLKGGCVQRG